MCKNAPRDSGRGTPETEQSHIFGWFRPSGRNHTPLICRVVRAARAVRMPGAGLGFPVGEPSVFTPNLRQDESTAFFNEIVNSTNVGQY